MEIERIAEEIFEKIKILYEENSQEKDVVEIFLSTEKMELTDSKIGGIPYIPMGQENSITKDGKNLKFLAQINFSQIKNLKDFPTEGILQFWILDNSLLGLDFNDLKNQTIQNNFRVIYYNEIEKNSQSYNLEKLENFEIKQPYKLKFVLKKEKENFDYEMLDSLFEKIYDELNLTNDKEELNDEVIRRFEDSFPEATCFTKCDGFPFFTQEDPREYNKELQKYDTLLFQIDGADERKISFGDGAVMNFFINREKLKNKDFSDILYNWDCY